jgi:glucosamine kinase
MATMDLVTGGGASSGGRVIGIDAGGSGTRIIMLEAGQVTALPDGPPMNALLTNDLARRLEEIIGEAGATAAGIGMPGLRSPRLARELGQVLTRRSGCTVRLASDGEAAQMGAFLGAPGIVVIAGTGSAAVGWDGQRRITAGGHGFLLGDEGSAYWIGQAAARAALHWADGLGGSEPIHRMVTKTVGSDLDELIVTVSAHPADRALLTVLAPPVTELAASDPAALRIAERAADHLAALADAVRRRLGHLPVAGAGGVFRAPVIWKRFAELTGAIRPLATPAVGAALLAAEPDRA